MMRRTAGGTYRDDGIVPPGGKTETGAESRNHARGFVLLA
jgi:hypothetical protein